MYLGSDIDSDHVTVMAKRDIKVKKYIRAVSYTHLDVYKRQREYSPYLSLS